MDDIYDELVKRFKTLAAKKGRIDQSVLDEDKADLMELRLTNAGYYTNAAMLLFCKDPDRWQLGAYTKIGFFENDADLRYQDEIHGSLLEQIDKIIEVIHLKYMKAKITYEGMQRIERYFVPDAALREALLNALCHKQYESGVPIQISVYEDKLYIANCGRLPDNWTADSLMSKHASALTTRALPTCIIWPASSRAGDVVLRKSVRLARNMEARFLRTPCIPAIL